jgi:hypothetical protein
MRISAMLMAILGFAALSGVPVSTAGASEVILDSSGFITGQQTLTDTFSVSGPGTLTVTLTDMSWPAPLASLDMIIGTTQGLLGPEMGVGTDTYQISGGEVFAQWFGTAQGPLDAGVYGLKIEFTPVPVPLPTSILLLLSAMGLLIWQRRDRSIEELRG